MHACASSYRYFARVTNPHGHEPPVRELATIRQARVETSRYLAELLDFAQIRLLEYARLLGEQRASEGMGSGGGTGAGVGLLQSCVWELQERG